MHKLTYLPLAKKDLLDIINYIKYILKAPEAAFDLVDALDISIARLEQFPYQCRLYQEGESFRAEYRMLPVKNYLVFYVVTELEVEIHRIIYARMNIEQQI